MGLLDSILGSGGSPSGLPAFIGGELFGSGFAEDLNSVADPLGFFNRPDVMQFNVPELPEYLRGDTNIDGMITFEDRTRIRTQQAEQRKANGRQGTILGGGVPVGPQSQQGSVLGGVPQVPSLADGKKRKQNETVLGM